MIFIQLNKHVINATYVVFEVDMYGLVGSAAHFIFVSWTYVLYIMYTLSYD